MTMSMMSGNGNWFTGNVNNGIAMQTRGTNGPFNYSTATNWSVPTGVGSSLSFGVSKSIPAFSAFGGNAGNPDLRSLIGGTATTPSYGMSSLAAFPSVGTLSNSMYLPSLPTLPATAPANSGLSGLMALATAASAATNKTSTASDNTQAKTDGDGNTVSNRDDGNAVSNPVKADGPAAATVTIKSGTGQIAATDVLTAIGGKGGTVTKDDFKAKLADDNGNVTADNVIAAISKDTSKMVVTANNTTDHAESADTLFNTLDTNKDGKIDAADLTKNKDGTLSDQEASTLLSTQLNQISTDWTTVQKTKDI